MAAKQESSLHISFVNLAEVIFGGRSSTNVNEAHHTPDAHCTLTFYYWNGFCNNNKKQDTLKTNQNVMCQQNGMH